VSRPAPAWARAAGVPRAGSSFTDSDLLCAIDDLLKKELIFDVYS
jgi:hypothetical protein